MIPNASKLRMAMDLIENRIANCISKESREEFDNLVLIRDEIYKGNYEIINEVLEGKM